MIATVFSPKVLRAALPALSLLILLGAVWYLNPRAISPLGFNLMFNLAVPIALATVAQMCVITVERPRPVDRRLCRLRRLRRRDLAQRYPLLGIAVLLGGILLYMAVGALIHLRNLPSITSSPSA